MSENPRIENTQKNIKTAKLIEQHVLNFQNNINSLAKDYNVQKENTILHSNILIEKMLSALKKAQTQNIEKKVGEDIIQSVISDLKIFNIEIKNYFKKQIEIFQQQRDKYIKGTLILNKKLEKVIYFLRAKIVKKEVLSLNDSNILKHIDKLEAYTSRLKNFEKIKFNNSSELRAGLIRILKNIKQEVVAIKSLLN